MRQKLLAVNKTPPIGNLKFHYHIPNGLPVSSYPEPAEFSLCHHNLLQLNISSLLNNLLCEGFHDPQNSHCYNVEISVDNSHKHNKIFN